MGHVLDDESLHRIGMAMPRDSYKKTQRLSSVMVGCIGFIGSGEHLGKGFYIQTNARILVQGSDHCQIHVPRIL